jgi:thiol-disulfide isomerase/thioredoxin
MVVIVPGAVAPPVDGVDLEAGPRALWFHKVTCPVCQLAAPVAERLAAAHPDLVVGLGQDPADRLDAFRSTYGITFPVVSDPPPYPASESYGLTVVPTLVLVQDGAVVDVVESWDRDGYNRVSARLAELTGTEPSAVSSAGDGLPAFRPG